MSRRFHPGEDPLPPRPEKQAEGLPLFGGPKPWDAPAFPYVEPPAARVTDPEASHVAARRAFADAQQQNRMIVAALRGMAPRCATSYGIADALGDGWDHVIISRRLAALRRKGFVYSFDGEEGRPKVESTDGGEHGLCALHCAADGGRPLGVPEADDTPFERRRAG